MAVIHPDLLKVEPLKDESKESSEVRAIHQVADNAVEAPDPVADARAIEHILRCTLGDGFFEEAAMPPVLKDLEIAVQFPFELLPPGKWDSAVFKQYFEGIGLRSRKSGRNWTQKVDLTRFDLLGSLSPNHIFLGKDGWDGYVLFEFPGTDRVVLESAYVGNAIYVLLGDWLPLISQTKSDVRLLREAHDFIRIIHLGDWFARLRTSLWPDENRASL